MARACGLSTAVSQSHAQSFNALVVKSNETLHGTPTKSRHRALANTKRDFQRQRIAVQGWIDRSQPRPFLAALLIGRATHETHDRREAQRRLQGKDGGQHCRGDSCGRGEHDKQPHGCRKV